MEIIRIHSFEVEKVEEQESPSLTFTFEVITDSNLLDRLTVTFENGWDDFYVGLHCSSHFVTHRFADGEHDIFKQEVSRKLENYALKNFYVKYPKGCMYFEADDEEPEGYYYYGGMEDL
jgi:hypothetical protein